jgi:hypothetical protein
MRFFVQPSCRVLWGLAIAIGLGCPAWVNEVYGFGPLSQSGGNIASVAGLSPFGTTFVGAPVVFDGPPSPFKANTQPTTGSGGATDEGWGMCESSLTVGDASTLTFELGGLLDSSGYNICGGCGTITISPGTITLNPGTISVPRAYNFTGGTTINGGILQLFNDGGTGETTNVAKSVTSSPFASVFRAAPVVYGPRPIPAKVNSEPTTSLDDGGNGCLTLNGDFPSGTIVEPGVLSLPGNYSDESGNGILSLPSNYDESGSGGPVVSGGNLVLNSTTAALTLNPVSPISSSGSTLDTPRFRTPPRFGAFGSPGSGDARSDDGDAPGYCIPPLRGQYRGTKSTDREPGGVVRFPSAQP